MRGFGNATATTELQLLSHPTTTETTLFIPGGHDSFFNSIHALLVNIFHTRGLLIQASYTLQGLSPRTLPRQSTPLPFPPNKPAQTLYQYMTLVVFCPVTLPRDDVIEDAAITLQELIEF